MNRRERAFRAIRFENPDVVPLSGGFSPATWHKYREDLVPLAKRLRTDFSAEPYIPGDFDKFPPTYRAGESYIDNWGCEWNCKVNGMEGIISKHPLEDWSMLESFRAPDPILLAEREPRRFDEMKKRAEKPREYFMWGPYERLWERLHFIRGYENTLMDLALQEPNIKRLLDIILEHNIRLVEETVKTGIDGLVFGDDWGDQSRLMINPDMWREWFKEPYRLMFRKCRDAGKEVFFHTDGYLLPIIEDLIDCGVTVLNLQSRPNGLDEIAKRCKGKVCVAIDMDRQYVFPFAQPEELKDYVLECVEKLDSDGGVIIHYDIYPDVPLKNIEAFAEVMEELRNP